MDSATLERVGAVLRLVCTLVAGIATMLGCYLDADELFTGACCVLALVCLLWCWWKNNNVTDAAIEAQAVLDALKEGDLTDLADADGDGEDDPEGDE